MKQSLPMIFAYVLPLKKKLINRMFVEKKRVVAKFLHRQSLGERFQQGTKLVFYETGGSKQIVAEASIIDAKMLVSSIIHTNFGDSVLLTESELVSYVNRYPNRKNKPLLTIVIDTPIRYTSPIQWKKSMSMIGWVLSSEEYNQIVRKDIIN